MYGIITLEGIDEALTQLRYKNKTALKYRLLTIIREHYDGVNNIDVVREIDTDEIVKILWETGNDPIVIKNRRKNLKSIKSSINTELSKLYHDGKNPEGIIIGPDNTFIMSDEARDNAIKSFKNSRGTDDLSSLEQFSNFINDIKDFLQNSPASFDLKQNVDPGTLHELKEVLQALSEKVGLYAGPAPYSPENSTPSKGNEPVSGYTSGMGGINVIDDVENLETAEQIEAIDPEVIEVEDVIDEINTEEIDEEPEELLDEVDDGDIEDVADIEEVEAEDITDDIEEVEVDDDPGQIDEELETITDENDDTEIVDVVEDVDDTEEFDPDDLTDLEDVTDDIDVDEAEELSGELLDEIGDEPDTITDDIDDTEIVDVVEDVDDTEEIDADDLTDLEDAADEIDAEEIDEAPEEILDEIDDSNIEDIVEEIADAEEVEAEDISGDIEEVVVDDTPDVIEEETDTALDDIDEAELVDVVEDVDDVEEIDADDLTDLEDAADEIDAEEIDEAPEELLDEIDDGDIEDVIEEVADVEEAETEDVTGDIDVDEVEELSGECLDEIGDEPDTTIDDIDDTEIVAVVEDVDDTEEFDPDDLTDLEDVDDKIDAEEIDEAPEELLDEIDEGDIEDIIEDVADVEEVEADDISDDIEEVEVDDIPVEVDDEPDASGRMLEEEVPEEFETSDSDDSRLLAENFNHSLAAMDKYYNQYIFIPGGDYIIGVGQPRWNEKPEETVQLSPFYCGKFPITNALFEIFVEKTGYVTTAEKIGHGTVYYGRRLHKIRNDSSGRLVFSGNSDLIIKEVKGACWYQPFGPGSTLHKKRNHPVVQISLEDAMAFAAWTGKKLPTEEEWEAAARTAQGYIFPWGNEWKNDACNTEESLVGDTMPVDHYLDSSNEFGILDLMGNVMEWTQTHSEYVSKEQNASVLYITKGGSFISANGICLPRRSKLQPESHSNILGFRCVAI